MTKDLYVTFWSIARLRVLQILGLPFLYIPLTMTAYVGLPEGKNNSISGIINFTRNTEMSFWNPHGYYFDGAFSTT